MSDIRDEYIRGQVDAVVVWVVLLIDVLSKESPTALPILAQKGVEIMRDHDPNSLLEPRQKGAASVHQVIAEHIASLGPA